MSAVEVLGMVVWGLDQVRKLLFPKLAPGLAAEDVLNAIAKIYQAIDDVTFGLATPAQAKADAQALIDALASNDAAADAAAEAKTP